MIKIVMRWFLNGLSKNKEHARGQSLVEFALVLPILFSMATLGLDGAQLFIIANKLATAATNGAKLCSEASLNPEGLSHIAKNAEDRAKRTISDMGIYWGDPKLQVAAEQYNVNIPRNDGTNDDYLFFRITVKYQPNILFARLFGVANQPLTATSTAFRQHTVFPK